MLVSSLYPQEVLKSTEENQPPPGPMSRSPSMLLTQPEASVRLPGKYLPQKRWPEEWKDVPQRQNSLSWQMMSVSRGHNPIMPLTQQNSSSCKAIPAHQLINHLGCVPATGDQPSTAPAPGCFCTCTAASTWYCYFPATGSEQLRAGHGTVTGRGWEQQPGGAVAWCDRVSKACNSALACLRPSKMAASMRCALVCTVREVTLSGSALQTDIQLRPVGHHLAKALPVGHAGHIWHRQTARQS